MAGAQGAFAPKAARVPRALSRNTGGEEELMRLSQSACSQQQRKGGGGEELIDTSQSMLLHMWARPMCLRMSVRIRGYVSTSSHPALMHEHVGAAAAGGGRVVFNCKSGAPLLRDIACRLVWVRPVQSVCSVWRVDVALARRQGRHAGNETPRRLSEIS